MRHAREHARLVSRHYENHLASEALTGGQFTLLVALAAKKSASVTDLSEILDLERTTLSRNLSPLERRGLVHRSPSEVDRREKIVSLTEKGEAKLSRAIPLWEAAQESLPKN